MSATIEVRRDSEIDDYADLVESIAADPDRPLERWEGAQLRRFAGGGAAAYSRDRGPLLINVDGDLIRRASGW